MERQVLDLYDDSVDLVTEPVTARLHVPAVHEHRLEVRDDGRLGVDGQPRPPEQVDRAGLGREPRDAVHLIEERPERPPGGDARVLLAERARRRVAGIGEEWLVPPRSGGGSAPRTRRSGSTPRPGPRGSRGSRLAGDRAPPGSTSASGRSGSRPPPPARHHESRLAPGVPARRSTRSTGRRSSARTRTAIRFPGRGSVAGAHPRRGSPRASSPCPGSSSACGAPPRRRGARARSRPTVWASRTGRARDAGPRGSAARP